jgi:hypothetical protein
VKTDSSYGMEHEKLRKYYNSLIVSSQKMRTNSMKNLIQQVVPQMHIDHYFDQLLNGFMNNFPTHTNYFSFPMYPVPPNEHLLENRTCRQCQDTFPITDKDMEFYEKVSPVFHGKRYMIPPPTLCPECRKIRRYAWRNEHKIFKRKCDATGKEILSLFSPDAPCPVYTSDYWYSDAWDAHAY